MAGLLTLSTELLMQIYCACDTVDDALHLSATNRRLQAIWLEHSNQVIEGILKPSIPAYEAAVDLAFTESRLQSSMRVSPSLYHSLPTLLRNVDLCKSACVAYSKFYEHDPLLAETYYFLRRMGLGLQYHQFRDDLYAELRAMSREPLARASKMCRWLLLKADLSEQIRQGVEDEDFDPIRDAMKETESAWDYADYIVSNGALYDLEGGTNNLPLTIQGYNI